MKNGVLKQALKSFAICLPFSLSIAIWGGYGSAVAKSEAIKDDMNELRASIYTEVMEDQKLENGEYALSEAEVKEMAEKAVAESEEYQKLSSEYSGWSKARMGLSVAGGFAFGLGAGLVSNNIKDDDEKGL